MYQFFLWNRVSKQRHSTEMDFDEADDGSTLLPLVVSDVTNILSILPKSRSLLAQVKHWL